MKMEETDEIVEIRGYHLADILAVATQPDFRLRKRIRRAMLSVVQLYNGLECYWRMRKVFRALSYHPEDFRVKVVDNLDVLCGACIEIREECSSEKCREIDRTTAEVLGFKIGDEYSGSDLIRIYSETNSGSKQMRYCNWIASRIEELVRQDL